MTDWKPQYTGIKQSVQLWRTKAYFLSILSSKFGDSQVSIMVCRSGGERTSKHAGLVSTPSKRRTAASRLFPSNHDYGPHSWSVSVPQTHSLALQTHSTFYLIFSPSWTKPSRPSKAFPPFHPNPWSTRPPLSSTLEQTILFFSTLPSSTTPRFQLSLPSTSPPSSSATARPRGRRSPSRP